MRFKRFMAVLSARNLEFLRDRSALSWNIVLPVLIVLGFAFAFTTSSQDLFKVGVYEQQKQAPGVEQFLQLQHIQFIPIDVIDSAIIKVERHQLDMLLDSSSGRYWINDSSANGYVLEQLLKRPADTSLNKQTVTGDAIRYVDWLIPGVLGMNIMFSSLFGVGYVIVRYRKNGVLKRLKATPLTAFEFLSAQVVSRLWLIVAVTSLVYAGTDLLVGFRMYGSYLSLLLVLVLGTFSMICLSLIVAARLSNEETANGILNLVSWPMMMLSGVWFSLEGSPEIIQQLALIFPLTHMIQAARAIMIDGESLLQVSDHLLVLIIMSAAFMTIGARSFKWE
ncbi:ABC transporter permease [Sedimenticola selenatireducens]|uniref:ABC transporter permease n=1 Tax=Sedimenticola selenatireducens TaxID=191960 RepID=A0A558DJW5_9GAMM|nr:ABC transporter permease [Sedimenticola selenatireducens]TVO72254.1 ABC transporter permease [Sedimenticola selenatireducens]TVT61305.1 MAG: ABC transporter permease [Sedimenticola selenatireducens]